MTTTSLSRMAHRARGFLGATAVALTFLGGAPAEAHFQELIPSHPHVSPETGPALRLELRFTHPMHRGPLMSMGQPVQFGVLSHGAKTDLREALTPRMIDGKQTYFAETKIKRPGDHIFYVEPAPYWEPAEGVMITHFTKVVVDGFAGEDGWDALVDFPVEIQPLTRPYGLWTGNSFQGIVLRDGKPVPFAEVEVEYRNDGSVAVPHDVFGTQVVKADGNGVFTYTMPKAGWWGFAALLEGEGLLANPDGEEVPQEWGALLWIHTQDMTRGPVGAATTGSH